MPYVQRNVGGAVCGCYAQPQAGYAEEFLDDANPEVVAYRATKTIDFSDTDNLDKALKALALLTRQYANALKGGTYVVKTAADTKSDFMTIYRALP